MFDTVKPTAIYFYQYLPPWRVDVFNEIGKYYNLIIVFTNADSEGFTYNRQFLLSKLTNVHTIFLKSGVSIGSRKVRFGIHKILKRIKPEYVFSHEYSPTSILAAIYKKHFGYRYVITTSDNVDMAKGVGAIKSKFRKFVLNHSNGIIVYSKNVEKFYKQTFPNLKVGICPNIQNPVSLLSYREEFPTIIRSYKQKFGIQGNDNIMLYVGRLVEVKGLDLLVKAFHKASLPNYKLVIVGSGVLETTLKQAVSSYGLTNKVIFAGQYSGAELYAWYDMANFFILPSRYEPFGAVVNEALVFGCPVVASKYIGALDFINETNGIIFNPIDETYFINALLEAYKKYSKPITIRKDLMVCRFSDFVSVFQPDNWNDYDHR